MKYKIFLIIIDVMHIIFDIYFLHLLIIHLIVHFIDIARTLYFSSTWTRRKRLIIISIESQKLV